jgi:hypothetical protein
MQTGHDTATEITRDIIVAMIGSGAMGVSSNAVKMVADAFDQIHAKVSEKWQAE